jgi:hypothetical protein
MDLFSVGLKSARPAAIDSKQRMFAAVADNVFVSAHPNMFLIEIDYSNVADPEKCRKLRSIPTELRLSEDNERLLAEFVREALRASPEYQAMLRTLKEDAQPQASAR